MTRQLSPQVRTWLVDAGTTARFIVIVLKVEKLERGMSLNRAEIDGVVYTSLLLAGDDMN